MFRGTSRVSAAGAACFAVLASATAIAGAPPNSVQSDVNFANTAMGFGVLANNSTGTTNTGAGVYALGANTTGYYNTAFGVYALSSETTGRYDVAMGVDALRITNGGENTGLGAFTLENDTNGWYNTAVGSMAMMNSNGTVLNTAVGRQALYSQTSGNGNIALGAYAGYNLTTGYSNIEIGNQGTSTDNAVIRIGTVGTQTATLIAGIANSPIVKGAQVFVTSSGQLGVLGSSERYKTDIATMGRRSSRLAQLRPVTFHYKADPQRETQYGLIAEEVDRVYPELVNRGEDGRPNGVRYDELAPMLLNELRIQQDRLAVQARRLTSQAREIEALKREFAAVRSGSAVVQPAH